MIDPYQCPNCGQGPLRLSVLEIEAGITEDTLYCDNCHKHWEITPGKELIECEGDE